MWGALALASLVMLTAPAAAQSAETDVVAQRGDARLTAADVRDLLDHLDAATRTQLQSNPAALATFVRERLLRMVLLNEAKAKGFEQLPDVVARANEARDSVFISAYVGSLVPADPAFPSQSDIAAAYEANKARFDLPKQYHLAQIAIPLPANATPAAIDDAKRKIIDAHAQAIKPKADFAALARKLSQERNSAAAGGEIGWVREDQVQPALRSALSALTEGAVSDVLQTPTGFVVVKLLGTRPPGPAPLADVQDQLVAALRQNRLQQVSQNYVNEMLRKEPIQLNEIDLARKIVIAHTP
jgi:hypothetical protein